MSEQENKETKTLSSPPNRKLNYRFGCSGAPLKKKKNVYKLSPSSTTPPPFFSLRATFASSIPVLDQGSVGDCTAFALGYYIQFLEQGLKGQNTVPSHLFLYYNGRVIGGYPTDEDTGLSVEDICSSAQQFGIPDEKLWPYKENNVFTKPPASVYQAAKAITLSGFQQIYPIQDAGGIYRFGVFKRAMTTSSFGLPIIFGMQCYTTFLSPDPTTGYVKLPNLATDSYVGSHCVLLIGYDDSKKQAQCINSWSSSWGDKGFFVLDYAYILNPSLCADFFICSSLSFQTST